MLRLFDRLKLTPSERRLVVAILAVAFLVVNYWVVWPRFGDYRTISDDMASMARKRKIYQAEIDRRPTYEVLFRKLQSEGSVLPAGEERIQFRSDMERLAREIGLQVPRWGEVLPERGQTTNAFFEAIGLTMQSVGGTESQFVDFLYRVGASNSTIRVRELTLNPGVFDSRAQGRTNLIGTIKLVASVQKAAPAPAPTPGPTIPAATNVASTTPAGAAGRGPAGPTVARTNAIPLPTRVTGSTNAVRPAGPPRS